MKDKVYIRADGGPEIGLGHLVRCMALAQMLKSEFSIHFFTKEIPPNLSNDIISQGFLLNRISSENDFFSFLTGKEIVVLDHYDFSVNYQKQIKSKGSKLVCIDDLHDKEFVADLIINHSPGINMRDYKAQPYTSFALGPRYALLRPVFLEAAKNKKVTRQIKTVMICFGGSDYKNMTKKVLEVVKEIKNFQKITVVLGAANPHLCTFDDLQLNDNRIEIFSALNEEQMCTLMMSTDLAIVPSSGILFEVVAAGCIPLTCYYADNQRKLFRFIEKNSGIPTFNGFGYIRDELTSSINKVINNLNAYNFIPMREEIEKSPYNNRNIFKILKEELVKKDTI